MKMRIFAVIFYLEGNENSGFYAWQSATSPRAECGWGATANEAISNLCRLLSGEFTKPVTWSVAKAKGMTDGEMCNNADFQTLRRQLYLNFVSNRCPLKEKDFSLSDLCKLIRDVGQDYILVNKRGVFETQIQHTWVEKWPDPEF